jgi:excisionase family DNA binding protein
MIRQRSPTVVILTTCLTVCLTVCLTTPLTTMPRGESLRFLENVLDDRAHREGMEQPTLFDPEPILLTIVEAARMLKIGRTLTYELIANGQLEVIHIGRATRVPLDAVHAFVERRRADATVRADR